MDACESTGTRGLTDDDYLRRATILGRDDRGGGMAMFSAKNSQDCNPQAVGS